MTDPLLFKPFGVTHLSPSQIDLFIQCPQKWYYRYIEKRPEKASGPLIVGNAAHHALASYFRYLMEGDERMQEAQLLTSFSEDFDKRVGKEPVDWGHDGSKAKNLLDKGKTKDRGVIALRSFSKELLLKIDPMSVERPVRRDIPGTDIHLKGYIDVLEAGAIRDHKFSAKMKTETDAHQSIQLSAYAWMVGKPSQEGKSEFDVSLEVATFGGKAKRLSSKRTLEQLEFYQDHILGRIVGALHQCLTTGNFPCHTVGWHCSEKFCSFWGECMGKVGK